MSRGVGSTKTACFTPPTWLLVVSIASFMLFGGFAIFFVVAGPDWPWAIAHLLLAITSGAGVADVIVSAVELDVSEIRIRGLTGVRRVRTTDLDRVRIDGGSLFLYLRDGSIVRMPAWLREGRKLRQILTRRIGA